jgi:Predicted glycosyltransferases
MKTLIIIPAYNEQDNIKRVVDNLINNFSQHDYIIINDGSKDKTQEILVQNNYNFITLPLNLGIGGGIQTGYQYALENGYDVAIQMDGDGQHDPAYIDLALSEMENQSADIVIGSRYINKTGFQSTGLRRFGINFLSKLIYIICRVNVKDVTSGYRLVNRKFIEEFAENYAQDYPEPEAIVHASVLGAKIAEVPVVMRERAGGQSSISPIKSIYYMIKVSIAILLYRFTIHKRR